MSAVVQLGTGARAAPFAGPTERVGPGDLFHDYVLTPYQPLSAAEGQLRSVNALYRSFAVAGVEAEGRRSVDALRAGLGPFRTVWGTKLDHGSGALAWEYYFYDPPRKHADLSVEAVARHLAPAFAVGGREPRPVPWQMFSVDCTVALLRGEGAADVHVYVDTNRTKGVDRSYLLRGDELELENIYSFHDPRREMPEILHRLKYAALHSRAEVHSGRLLPPELVECGTICVANKRRSDAVYFSRLTTPQLLAGLDLLGWPASIADWLRAEAPALAHLFWDLGFDFRCGADGAFTVTKSGFYGSF